MIRRVALLVLLVVALPVRAAAAELGDASLKGQIVVSGSSVLAPAIRVLGMRFRARYPNLAITVNAGGSNRGVAEVSAGRADIGMVSRQLGEDERGLFAIPLARDGVAFVVHRENPVRALTRGQAAQVLGGQTLNWNRVGGLDAPIEVISRGSDRGAARDIVVRYLGIAPDAIRAAHVATGDYADVVQRLATNRNAIGFLSVGLVDDLVQKGHPLKALALDGVEAGSGAVREGVWPMARAHYLVVRRVPAGAAKAFIQFLLSPTAYEVLAEYDFVPYSDQGAR